VKINFLKRSKLILLCFLLISNLTSNFSFANDSKPKGQTYEDEIENATIRGEALLNQCVINSSNKVPAVDNKKLLALWSEGNVQSIQNQLKTLSPQGKQRGELLIKWFSFLHLIQENQTIWSTKETKNLLTSLNSLLTQIFTNRPFATSEHIITVTKKFNQLIRGVQNLPEFKKTELLFSLAHFQDSLITEMQRTHEVVAGAKAENEAIARPIIFAALGTATFITAMLTADPILAAGIKISQSLGLGSTAGQVAATGLIAGIGVTGVETLVDIAIPRWTEAAMDATRRNIPLSCSLVKQAEISKAQELTTIVRAFSHGAQVGVLLTGITLLTPRIFNILGGVLIRYGEAEKISIITGVGNTFYKLAPWVDDAALVFVAGAVAIGAISETGETISSINESLSFNDIIAFIKTEIEYQKQINNQDKLAQLDDLLRLAQATQIGFQGDAIRHSVDLMVCGYLVYHFANGEFMASWKKETDKIIENLALASDDAPTGINAAYTAVKKATVSATSDPISIKLWLLKAKLISVKLGLLSPTLSQSYDFYINMNNGELEENIKIIEEQVKKLVIKNS
jgi:hypothetical protein